MAADFPVGGRTHGRIHVPPQENYRRLGMDIEKSIGLKPPGLDDASFNSSVRRVQRAKEEPETTLTQ